MKNKQSFSFATFREKTEDLSTSMEWLQELDTLMQVEEALVILVEEMPELEEVQE